MTLAGLELTSNIFLAPLAGYTNYPFRKLCMEMGAGITFTEMVSCKGLLYGNEDTKILLHHGEEQPKAAQIFGCDPQIMRRACESEELAPFDLVDINMGCPMPKIIRNGEGSALMENLPLAEKVISECAKSGKKISVKFRTGVTEQKKITAEFARLCAGAGAVLLTVHGRTRERIYAGETDVKEIAAAKNAVPVPVIANGGIMTAEDAKRLLRETGADGVMIARGALFHPQIFAELTGRKPLGMRELFRRQLFETEALYGSRFATVFMRKMAAFYCRGMRGAAEIKRRLFSAGSPSEVLALAEQIFS